GEALRARALVVRAEVDRHLAGGQVRARLQGQAAERLRDQLAGLLVPLGVVDHRGVRRVGVLGAADAEALRRQLVAHPDGQAAAAGGVEDVDRAGFARFAELGLLLLPLRPLLRG